MKGSKFYTEYANIADNNDWPLFEWVGVTGVWSWVVYALLLAWTALIQKSVKYSPLYSPHKSSLHFHQKSDMCLKRNVNASK